MNDTITRLRLRYRFTETIGTRHVLEIEDAGGGRWRTVQWQATGRGDGDYLADGHWTPMHAAELAELVAGLVHDAGLRLTRTPDPDPLNLRAAIRAAAGRAALTEGTRDG